MSRLEGPSRASASAVDFDEVSPVPTPSQSGPWSVRPVAAGEGREDGGHTVVLSVPAEEEEGEAVRVRLSRAIRGRWRDCYPVGAHDIVVEVLENGLTRRASAALWALTEELGVRDPACRRIVAPCRVTDLSRMAMLEEAGFDFVTEVDQPDGTFGLLLHTFGDGPPASQA